MGCIFTLLTSYKNERGLVGAKLPSTGLGDVLYVPDGLDL